ncbi:MAG TPA: hypothetical protein VJO32_14980 [Ktedonobacteraceae bacterium]|nr:hypothetical protein [Ktedonobacteraceae bacterium]
MQDHFIRARIITFFQRIGYGILLAPIQLGLVFLGIPRFNTISILIVGLVLYLVIPGLAGLRASRRRERASTGLVTGFVTGLICAIIIMVVLFILVAIALNTPPPVNRGRYVPLPVAFVAAYIIVIALFLNFLGVLLATLGGWLGGFIGRRWITKPAKL